MDSVTRPVGHLPPSVYWRRRAIVLVGLAVLIALVAWACTAGGGGDDKKNASSEGSSPPPSAPASPGVIGPGAATGANAGTNPAQPGAASGANSGGNGAPVVPGTAGGTAGSGTAGNAAGAATAGAANGGATGTTGQGQAPQQPGAANGGAVGGQAGKEGGAPQLLPCLYPGNATLVLTGDRPENTRYRVGEQVNLTLEIRNTGTETCAVDMAQTSATVEIRSGNDLIWSPAHCASSAQVLTQIQPGKSVTHTWTWNWSRSDP
ncbi:hypothetical protein, partial [Yinghuangia sp. YIM S10712]|uniref:hypothetical protein n=1 Tax=Yinghuangia sp. YIM S10712 TaxID=3436930 RepID=UPI003F533FBE